MAKLLISFFVIAYAVAAVWAIRHIKIYAGTKNTLWLVPLVMLVTALAVKIVARKGSVFPAMTGSPEFFIFVGETFFDAMAVLWSALLGAVFLTGTIRTTTASLESADENLLALSDKKTTGRTDPQPPSAKEGEVSSDDESVEEHQQIRGDESTLERVTFSTLLKEFRSARPAFSVSWKWLLPIPGALLLAVVVLIALPAEWRELGLVRATALVTVLACYLYGLWLLVLPLRTLLDPVPELMRELDRRYEQESALRDFLHSMPEQQRRLMSARLERYVRRLSGASRVSQLAFVLSPLFAFLLEQVSQGGLSSLERGPLLIGGMLLAVLFGALIGIMQLRRALVELESLQFSLGEQPADPASLRYG